MNVKDEPELDLLFLDEDQPAERPGLPADFGVGSEVLVLPASYRHRGLQERIPGIVVYAARVWIVVKTAYEISGKTYYREYRLRRDTQDDGSKTNYKDRFRTDEQDRWYRVLEGAEAYLRQQRIDLTGSPWQHRRIELARAVWKLNEPEASS